MTDCSKFEGLISMLIDNELSDTESKELKEHLDSCEPCRRLLNEWKRSTSLFKQVIEKPIEKGRWDKVKENILNEIDSNGSECESREESISAHIDQELSETDSAEIKAHMACCERCRKLYNQWLASDKLYQRSAIGPIPEARWKIVKKNILNELKQPVTIRQMFVGLAASLLLVISVFFMSKGQQPETAILATIETNDPLVLLTSGEVMLRNMLSNSAEVPKIREVALKNNLSDRYGECQQVLVNMDDEVQAGFKVLQTITNKLQYLEPSEIESFTKSLNESGAIEKVNNAKEKLISQK